MLEPLSTVSSECSEGPAEAMGNSEQNDWELKEEWKDSTGTGAMSASASVANSAKPAMPSPGNKDAFRTTYF